MAIPNSASSQRMQQNVRHNINQQERIKQGMQSGELTNREAGRLERGEAHVNRCWRERACGGEGAAGGSACRAPLEQPDL